MSKNCFVVLFFSLNFVGLIDQLMPFKSGRSRFSFLQSCTFRKSQTNFFVIKGNKSWSAIRSHSSLCLGSQMSRLRQVTKQMSVYLSTLSLGVKTFYRTSYKSVLHLLKTQYTTLNTVKYVWTHFCMLLI